MHGLHHIRGTYVGSTDRSCERLGSITSIAGTVERHVWKLEATDRTACHFRRTPARRLGIN